MIPYVEPSDYDRLEGAVADMGWIMAEQRFRVVFPGHYEYCGPWDQVRKLCGCFEPTDRDAWARGMNRIIEILNDLPEQCSKDQLRSAFGI